MMRPLCRLVLLSFSFTVPLSLAFAVPPEVFRTEYDAPTHHSDEGICVASSGGFVYAAGSAYSPVTATYDAHLVALTARGAVRWVHEDRVPGENEVPSKIGTDPWGNVVMVSFVRTGQAASLRVAKFNAAGTRLWVRDMSRGTSIINFDEAAFAIDAMGNAYVGNARDRDMLVAKVAPDSTVLWERTFASPQDWEEVTSLAVDPTGGVVATGVAGSIQGGYRTLKYDDLGNLVWVNDNSGQIGNTLGPAFVKRLSNGNFIVLCTPEGTFGVPQYRVFAIGPNGVTQWQKDYTPSPQNDCEATGLAIDRSDSIIVAGFRVNNGSDAVTVKYDGSGNRLWEAAYTPSSATSGGVVVDMAGNVTLCGSLNSGSSSGFIVRYNTIGNQVWTTTKTSDTYGQLDVDGKGNVTLIGSVFHQTGSQDFVVSRYSWAGHISPTP
ncbi:MAG: hypothetical protein JSS66_09905 [Armatimonadetes bacterium]|nr:hypothetical protein [Armatimonadota bacterium]